MAVCDTVIAEGEALYSPMRRLNFLLFLLVMSAMFAGTPSYPQGFHSDCQ